MDELMGRWMDIQYFKDNFYEEARQDRRKKSKLLPQAFFDPSMTWKRPSSLGNYSAILSTMNLVPIHFHTLISSLFLPFNSLLSSFLHFLTLPTSITLTSLFPNNSIYLKYCQIQETFVKSSTTPGKVFVPPSVWCLLSNPQAWCPLSSKRQGTTQENSIQQALGNSQIPWGVGGLNLVFQ